jgi:hypothetical protein
MMNNKIILLLVSVFCLSCVAKSAYASQLDFDLGCPASVKVGAPLNVVVKNIKNWDGGNSVVLKRYMSGIVVNNATNTVGDAGFYGPFDRSYATAKTVPPANYSQTPVAPGTFPNFLAPVVASAPAVPGTMAMVFLQFITSDGQEMESGNCLVNIIP